MSKINLNDFSSTNKRVKYACAKQAIIFSKENPAALYPSFDFFVKLLHRENQIIKWTAIQVIGNLSKVDKKKKVDKLLPQIVGFLKSGKLITANNAILALSEIARNKPEYSDKIIKEFLKIEDYNFDTRECKNIVIGKVLLALDKLNDQIKNQKGVLSFVERQTNNSRNATKKKAQALIKKL